MIAENYDKKLRDLSASVWRPELNFTNALEENEPQSLKLFIAQMTFHNKRGEIMFAFRQIH